VGESKILIVHAIPAEETYRAPYDSISNARKNGAPHESHQFVKSAVRMTKNGGAPRLGLRKVL